MKKFYAYGTYIYSIMILIYCFILRIISNYIDSLLYFNMMFHVTLYLILSLVIIGILGDVINNKLENQSFWQKVNLPIILPTFIFIFFYIINSFRADITIIDFSISLIMFIGPLLYGIVITRKKINSKKLFYFIKYLFFIINIGIAILTYIGVIFYYLSLSGGVV